MVEKMAYANRDTGNVLGAAETAGLTEYLDHPAINPKQSKHWALDIAVAFPPLHINLSPGGFWSHRFWPIRVDRRSVVSGRGVSVQVDSGGCMSIKKKKQ